MTDVISADRLMGDAPTVPYDDTQGENHPLTDDRVLAYLLENPQFFQTHADALSRIAQSLPELPPLAQKQLAKLRKDRLEIEQKLMHFTAIVRENSDLFDRLHQLNLNLMACQSPTAVMHILQPKLIELFSLETIVFYSWVAPNKPLPYFRQLGIKEHWQQTLKQDLNHRQARCGVVEAQWRNGLFDHQQPVQSMCLVPLGIDKIWGVLAIGSQQNRYHDSMGTLLLNQLGDMLSLLLQPAFSTTDSPV